MREKSIAVIIVAAGKGERASLGHSDDPKQYRPLSGVPVLKRTIAAFLDYPAITQLVVVIHPDHATRYGELGVSDARLLPPVIGGASRQASVLEGLKALAPTRPDLVLIQDAARPFAAPRVIGDVIAVLDQPF